MDTYIIQYSYEIDNKKAISDYKEGTMFEVCGYYPQQAMERGINAISHKLKSPFIITDCYLKQND